MPDGTADAVGAGDVPDVPGAAGPADAASRRRAGPVPRGADRVGSRGRAPRRGRGRRGDGAGRRPVVARDLPLTDARRRPARPRPRSLSGRGFWTAALTEERFRGNTVAVAERGGRVIGVAMSGPPLDQDARWATQLYVLYVRAADHGRAPVPGSWARSSRRRVRGAVVADRTPAPRRLTAGRASSPTDEHRSDGVREIRMVRTRLPQPAAPDPPPAG